MSFPNDYLGVHNALTAGKNVSSSSELGQCFRALAESIRSGQPPVQQRPKPGLLEMLRAHTHKKPAAPPAEGDVLAS